MRIETGVIIAIAGLLVQLVIAGITYKGVRKQIVNSGITQFRKQWIDDLRNTISEFYSSAKNIMLLWGQYNKHNIETQTMFKIMEEKVCKIKLLSNPTEDDHDEIIVLVEKISAPLYQSDFEPKAINKNLEDLVVKAQIVLKREWEVTKKGE